MATAAVLAGCAPLAFQGAGTSTTGAAAAAGQRAQAGGSRGQGAAAGGSAGQGAQAGGSAGQPGGSANEVPTPTAPQTVADAGAATPAEAIRQFADAYINWTSATVVGDMKRLAADSAGQARSGVSLLAAQSAHDYELQRGGIANHGIVEAVSPLPAGQQGYVVVTLERTTASASAAYDGLGPAWHVAVANVAQLQSGGWVVSQWQPES